MNEDLGWLDYGARFYDPSIARFAQVDPLANAYSSTSSYAYVLNNPMRMIDPTGMSSEDALFSAAKSASGTQYVTNSTITIGGDDSSGEGDENESYPPDGCTANCWQDGDGLFTRNSSSDDWNWTDSNGADRGIWSGESNNGVGLKYSPENSILKAISKKIGEADGAVSTIGGFGFNHKQINTYGNTGRRFRADLFGQNIVRLKGVGGEKFVNGLKIAGPILSVGTVGLSWVSNQPRGYKIADTISGGASLFGGFPGVARGIIWSFSIKPYHRAVVYPTAEENAIRHHSQIKYSDYPLIG